MSSIVICCCMHLAVSCSSMGEAHGEYPLLPLFSHTHTHICIHIQTHTHILKDSHMYMCIYAHTNTQLSISNLAAVVLHKSCRNIDMVLWAFVFPGTLEHQPRWFDTFCSTCKLHVVDVGLTVSYKTKQLLWQQSNNVVHSFKSPHLAQKPVHCQEWHSSS